MFGRGLSHWGLIAVNGGEDKVDWEPRPTSLYQPISLGMVGHGLHSFDAKDLVQFLNYITSKASTSITQEPGQGPKDRDVTSI